MPPEETKELYRKIDDLTGKVNRLISYLDSDIATNRKGVVESLDILNHRVNELLTREKVYRAKAATAGAIGGAMLTILWQVITSFFHTPK